MNCYEENYNPIIGDFLGILVLVAVVFVTTIIVLTWQISIFFLLSVLLLWLVRKKDNVIKRATYKLTVPISIGMGIVFIFFALINVYGLSDDNWLKSVEVWLIEFRLKYKSYIDFKLYQYILILIFIITINYGIPRLKLVSIYIYSNNILTNVLTVLTTVLSFTFFGQLPIDHLVKVEHEEAISNYKILLRKEKDKVGEYLSAKTLTETTRQLTANDILMYKKIFTKINDVSNDNQLCKALIEEIYREYFLSNQYKLTSNEVEVTKEITESIAKLQFEHIRNNLSKEVNIVSFQQFESGKPQESIYKIPNSLKERLNRNSKILAKNEEVEKINLKSQESIKALKDIFSKVIESTIPNNEKIVESYIRIVESYIRKLVSEYAEYLFKNVIEENYKLSSRLEKLESLVINLSINKYLSNISWLNRSNFTENIDEKIEKMVVNEYKIQIENKITEKISKNERLRERARNEYKMRKTRKGR